MAQLVVRKIEDQIVKKLRLTAAKAGISMEEEHRRILREALGKKRGSKTFKAHLLSIPIGNDESIFNRQRTTHSRKLEL